MSNEGRIRIAIGRRSLSALKMGGKWRFTCTAWPDLAAKFNGAESASQAIEEFTGRCLEAGKNTRRLLRKTP